MISGRCILASEEIHVVDVDRLAGTEDGDDDRQHQQDEPRGDVDRSQGRGDDQRHGEMVDLAQPPVELDRGVPLALLITEVVTNSLKHAFPGGRKGTVRIGLAQDGPTRLLRIADDVRYDIELLQHHYTASWEQVCHRLTTMRRKDAAGIPAK